MPGIDKMFLFVCLFGWSEMTVLSMFSSTVTYLIPGNVFSAFHQMINLTSLLHRYTRYAPF